VREGEGILKIFPVLAGIPVRSNMVTAATSSIRKHSTNSNVLYGHPQHRPQFWRNWEGEQYLHCIP